MPDTNSKLISNQVFKELQVPTADTGSTTGTVIYANRYTPGVNPVDMPQEYADIFNSDFGEVGNNVLVQLEQKIQGLPNGPWFLDSIDNTLYIHNRKFNESPTHLYTYQQGTGELLDIDFQTQYITRRLDGTVSSGISSDKILNTDIVNFKNVGNYLADTEEDRKKALLQAYRDYLDDKISYDVVSTLEREYGLPVATSTKESNSIIKLYSEVREKRSAELLAEDASQKQSLKDEYRSYRAEVGKKGKAGADKLYLSAEQYRILNYEDLTLEVIRIITEVTGGDSNAGIKLMNAMKNAAKNGTLDQFMKAYFRGTHTFNEAKSRTNPRPYQELKVDPRLFSGSPEKIKGMSTPDNNKTYTSHQYNSWKSGQWLLAEKGISNLKNNKEVLILDNNFNRDGYTPGDKIRVFMPVEKALTVPQHQVILAYFTRKYGLSPSGSSWIDIEKRINQVSNQGKKITERKLVCNMTCIGNPKLTSSQVLIISNVGKWSGLWYIKSCTHQLVNGQGYTCKLDLIFNNSLQASDTSSIGIDTKGAAISNMISTGSKVEDNSSSNINFKATPEEILWYYSERKKGITNAYKAIQILLYSREHGYDNDTGVVRKTVHTSTTGISQYLYELDPELKYNLDDLRKYNTQAAKIEEELNKSLNENKNKK